MHGDKGRKQLPLQDRNRLTALPRSLRHLNAYSEAAFLAAKKFKIRHPNHNLLETRPPSSHFVQSPKYSNKSNTSQQYWLAFSNHTSGLLYFIQFLFYFYFLSSLSLHCTPRVTSVSSVRWHYFIIFSDLQFLSSMPLTLLPRLQRNFYAGNVPKKL